AGLPLSGQQIAQIKEQYNPQKADEPMKDAWVLLTTKQKKTIVNNLKNQLKQCGYPLSRKQIKHYMNYGLKRTARYKEILTDDQKKALITSGK
ncbi:hypothetical protein ACFL30_01295, partial [Candidatus Latescibacterota bacterium]